ncbi:MAG: hypothetical protein WCC26_21030 [Terracidiphilus sp.]
MSKRFRSSQSKAVIEAALQIAQEYAQHTEHIRRMQDIIKHNPHLFEKALTDLELVSAPMPTRVIQ